MLQNKLVKVVQLLLGSQYLLSGLNWWVKILPFPSILDPRTGPYKHEIVRAMIETGWMFELTKLVELATGIALLLNVFAPLMLVVSMAVAVTAFLVDAFIVEELAGWIAGTVTTQVAFAKILDMIFFGGAVLAMQIYLLLAYLPLYRPMLVARPGAIQREEPSTAGGAAMTTLGIVAAAIGVVALGWFAAMIVQTVRG